MSTLVRRILSQKTGIFGTISGVLGVVSALLSQIGALAAVPAFVKVLVPVICAIVAVILLRFSLPSPSRLLQPERFRLLSRVPTDLVGRDEDIERLVRNCSQHVLTFLVGESGAGKTALIQAGLVPTLSGQRQNGAGSARFVPVNIDLSAVPWERGLHQAVADSLCQLEQRDLDSLKATAPVGNFDAWSWIRELPARTPKRLLLIFDQFDDYLSAHRERFYEGTTLRRASEIATVEDWREIQSLLRDEKIHLIVIARSDVGAALSALQFVDESKFTHQELHSIKTGLISPLLERIALAPDQSPVIENPELGWMALQHRILRDIQDEHGEVLPIRLAVALSGLRFTPRHLLTLREYEKIGGLSGLEKQHVQHVVESACRVANIPVDVILEAICTLLVAPDGKKATSCSHHDFVTALRQRSASGTAEEAVKRLLEERMLRASASSGKDDPQLLLYHDYLARPLRDAHGEAKRWDDFVYRRNQQLAEATGLEKWRALLSMREQLKLVRQILARRVSLASAGGLIAKSFPRWIPVGILVVLAGLGVWQYSVYRNQMMVRATMKAIGHGELTEEEARDLKYLWSGDRGLLILALQFADDIAVAKRAATRAQYIAQIAVGLDVTGRRSDKLAESTLLPALTTGRSGQVLMASAIVASDQLRLLDSTSNKLAQAIVEQMKDASQDTLPSLATALGKVSARIDADQSLMTTSSLLDRLLGGTPSPEEEFRVSEAVSAIAPRLDSPTGVRILSTYLPRLLAQSDPTSICRTSQALARIANAIPRGERARLAPPVWEKVRAVTNRPNVVSCLGVLAVELTPGESSTDASEVAVQLLTRLQSSDDSHTQSGLAAAVASLKPHLESRDVLGAARVVLGQIRQESQTLYGGGALVALSPLLRNEDIQSLADEVLDLMRTFPPSDAQAIQDLGRILVELAPRLDSQANLSLARRLLTLAESANDLQAESYLRLQTQLIPSLDAANAVDLARDLLAWTKARKEQIFFSEDTGRALCLLCEKLKDGAASRVRDQLQQEMIERYRKANGMLALAGTPTDQIKQIIEQIAHGPEGQVFFFGQFARQLIDRLNDGELASLSDLLLTNIIHQWNPRRLDVLSLLLVRALTASSSPVFLSSYKRSVDPRQVYADLLKGPFTVGAARNRLLAALLSDRAQALRDPERCGPAMFQPENARNARGTDNKRLLEILTQQFDQSLLPVDLVGPPPWQF